MTLRAYLKKKRGRATALAHAMGVSIAIISMWANYHRRIPAERCGRLSALSGLPMHELRRDLFKKT